MKSLTLLNFLLVLFVSNTAMAQTYELVWSDEFDYTGLPATEKWGYDTDGNAWDWGNNELQFYTDSRQENAWVENDVLTITARKEQMGGKEYTSARLITKNKGDWLYGKVEVRAKLPGGTGTWPAIWMLPTDWEYGNWPSSGEIDIMEYVGYDPGVVHGTIHTEAYNHILGTQKGAQISVSDAETEFHVYSLRWTPDKIEVYVDDTKYFTFLAQGDYTTWPFDKRFHLLLNVAVGGSWGGAQGVDNDIFPVKMEVDYVRVYQDKTTSINKIGEVTNITISPNPVRDVISISSTKEFNLVEVFTLNGKKMGSYDFSVAKSIKINASDLKPGIYFLSIKNKIGEIIGLKKFLKK
jgi:beta-glucanase (GH16 family)